MQVTLRKMSLAEGSRGRKVVAATMEESEKQLENLVKELKVNYTYYCKRTQGNFVEKFKVTLLGKLWSPRHLTQGNLVKNLSVVSLRNSR